jgi:hypothetical protein
VPWGGTDSLFTPQLIISNGDIITLKLRTSNWWPGKMKVMWKNAATGVVSELETLVPTTNYESYAVDISAAAGTNYLVFVPICDDPWAWGGELTMDNVIGISPMLWFVDEDLKASNLQGTATPTVNQAAEYQVTVQNLGNNAVSYNSFQVKLMQVDPAGDIELASTVGLTTSHLQARTYTLSATFQASGEYDIYAMVDYSEDMIPSNNATPTQHVWVQVSGTVEVETGNQDDESYWLPMRTGSYYTVSQTIYPSSMIGQTGALTGMKYFYTNNQYSDINNIPVKVYVGLTTETHISSYLSPDDMTLVFDDTVNFPLGYHEWYLPYSVPINYTGGNLVTYVYQANPNIWNPIVDFKVSNVSDTLSGWSDSYYYINPAIPDSGTSCNKVMQIPTTNFFVNTAGFGEITGTVFDENLMPFPGVTVTIDGTTVSDETDGDGVYFINEILGGQQSLTASVFEYEDNSLPIDIQAGIVNQLDFTMTLKPRIDIIGTVVGNDDPQNFLEGALVSLNGYSNVQAETNADGEFLLPWVYGNETYTIVISLNGFETYMDNNIVVTDGNIDLGTIELIELMSVPYTVYAEDDANGMNLTWMEPNTGMPDVYAYELLGNQGYANEPMEHVWLGNIYETNEMGSITSVDVYFVDYMTNSGEVSLDILDADGNVIMSSEPFMTEKNTWINIDIPDVYFGGNFYAMIHWQDNPETTDFLGCEVSDPGAHGPNQGYIMYPGGAPYHVSEIIEDYCTFEINVNVLLEDATKAGRAIEGYNIYTGLFEDIFFSMTWAPVNGSPVTELTYLDETWPPAEEGEYIYAVEAVYTTGESVFSFSNTISYVPVGVEELSENAVNVYPNPARNVLFIENSVSGRAVIYNVSGQLIGDYRLDGQLDEINVENFKSGLYIIQIVGDNNEVTTEKFFKD